MNPTLLALETATQVCSVAVVRDEKALAELTLRRPRKHAEQLATLVRDALRYAELQLGDLDAVAVSRGPGSYTGLRIGVSTAKGLALAADLSLVGVPTLEALASSVAATAAPGDVLCALLDARRQDVYATAFRVTADGDLTAAANTEALAVNELANWLPATKGRLWLLGTGAEKAALPLRETGRFDLRLLPFAHHGPTAAWVGRLGLERLRMGATENLAAFEPYYLKEFVTT